MRQLRSPGRDPARTRPLALLPLLLLLFVLVSAGASFGSGPSRAEDVRPASTNAAPTWSNASSASVLSPPGTFGASMAYDPVVGYAVFFGGTDPQSGQVLGATWTYSNGTWDHLPLSSADSPPARHFAGMVYDAAIRAIVLFGGGSVGGFLNDTWTFTASGWTSVCTFCGPTPRWGLSLAYDSTDRQAVLFGGCDAPPGTTGSLCPLGDTWTFNGTSWTETSTSGGPVARYWASFADDPGDQGALLFGGYSAPSTLGDTWVYRGGNWTIASPASSPSTREGATLVYDQGTGTDILFGGSGATPSGGIGVLGDTYGFDRGRWSALTPSSSPPASAFGAATFDAGQGRLVLFGGQSATGVLAETWVYGAPWSPSGPTSSSPWPAYLPWLLLGLVGVAVAAVAVVGYARRKHAARLPSTSSPAPGGGSTASRPAPSRPPSPAEITEAARSPLVVVETTEPSQFWKVVAVAAGDGTKALVFSPSPEEARARLPGASIQTVSHTEGPLRVLPGDLDRVGHMLDAHLALGPGRWVIFDGVNMFLDATSPRSVRRLLEVARELAQERHGHVMFRLNAGTLAPAALSQLEEGATPIRLT